jgi:hypothetical protein
MPNVPKDYRALEIGAKDAGRCETHRCSRPERNTHCGVAFFRSLVALLKTRGQQVHFRTLLWKTFGGTAGNWEVPHCEASGAMELVTIPFGYEGLSPKRVSPSIGAGLKIAVGRALAHAEEE